MDVQPIKRREICCLSRAAKPKTTTHDTNTHSPKKCSCLYKSVDIYFSFFSSILSFLYFPYFFFFLSLALPPPSFLLLYSQEYPVPEKYHPLEPDYGVYPAECHLVCGAAHHESRGAWEQRGECANMKTNAPRHTRLRDCSLSHITCQNTQPALSIVPNHPLFTLSMVLFHSHTHVSARTGFHLPPLIGL